MIQTPAPQAFVGMQFLSLLWIIPWKAYGNAFPQALSDWPTFYNDASGSPWIKVKFAKSLPRGDLKIASGGHGDLEEWLLFYIYKEFILKVSGQ